jgi:RNA polymerase sigma factor (sigma-70 family)
MARAVVAAPSPVRSRQSRARVNGGERVALQQELTALARGERAAFDPLFARLWPLVRGFAGRCLPAGEADDAAQEALLRVFYRASEFDVRRDALHWVLGVAAWQIRTHRTRTRRRREEEITAVSDRADAAPSPETAAMARESAAALERALADLTAADAATLIAYARGERPDLPGPTFRKRVERALARLRTRWRMDHGSF